MTIKETKTALIKTLNGEFPVEFANSRDFINGLRSAIERKSLYEFTHGNTRVLINANNIVSIEMESEALAPVSPFKTQNISPSLTDEEIRENQLMLQPDLVKFEAKAKGMQKMKDKEDAVRKAQFEQIYGKTPSGEVKDVKLKDSTVV